ncbi:MAG: Mfa1 fimbrilin C-terminal domain-containing protein [Prevotella sp.]|nr:Mfa1 fimbrilin C-terminal domain-containing protein [Prevotella sp.]
MKKLSFLALAAVGLLFGACSDKEVVENQVVNPGELQGDQYLAIGINLPQDPSSTTRSAGTDNNGNVTYNDGLASEYAVKDAMLLLFDDNTNEDDAEFIAAYDLSTTPWTTTNASNNVTEYSRKVIKKVSDVSVGDRILVILNRNNIINLPDGSKIPSVNGTPLSQKTTTADGTTFKTFREMLATVVTTTGEGASAVTTVTRDAAAMTSNGFFMTNSPLIDKAGSSTSAIDASAKTTTLVTISDGAIYETEALAEAGTVYDEVYVERGMAKVTMEKSHSTDTDTGSGLNVMASKMSGEANGLSWEVTGWILDNTAPTSYLVRSTDGDADFRSLHTSKTNGVYRYAGNTEINNGEGTASSLFRTYFAKSKGFDELAKANGKYELTKYKGANGDTFSDAFGEANPKYCFENTFDVDHQMVQHTTLVQVEIQAKIIGGSAEDLYIISGQKSTVYTLELLETYVKAQYYNYLKANGCIKEADVALYNSTHTEAPITLSSNVDLSVTITIDATDATKASITAVGVNQNSPNKSYYTINAANDLVAMQNAIGEFTVYDDGKSYYNIRIKHFGDNLTPWNNGEYGSGTAPAPGDVTKIYPNNNSNRDNDYLGRYGVLRNNWYAISVSSVRMLGNASPNTDTWDETPDDELDNYLAFRINVLSWAKRTQGAEL